MAAGSDPMVGRSAPGTSRFWRLVLHGFLRGAPPPLMRLIRRHVSAAPFEEFLIVGRRSGKPRRLMLSLYDVDGQWYVGHPNGTSNWVLNLEAAGRCTVVRRDGTETVVAATLVPRGPERDSVLDVSGRQPAPAGAIYRLARRHIDAGGQFFRLTPVAS